MWIALALLCAALSPAPEDARRAEPANTPYRVEFEDDEVRVLRIAIAPGEDSPAFDHLDGVLVFLTRDLQGRMPTAEAVWQPAGAFALENPGPGRFEALLVELKTGASPCCTGLPPEAGPPAYQDRGAPYYGFGRREYDVRTERLLDNSRVTVTRQRFGPLARIDLWHFHGRDHVFVYLSRGQVAGTTTWWGSQRVERGQVDVLPPNVLHVFSNAGSDPIEFISIHPK